MAVAMQFGVSLIDQGILTLTGYIKLDLGLSAFTAGLIVASFALGRIAGAYVGGPRRRHGWASSGRCSPAGSRPPRSSGRGVLAAAGA